MRYNRYMNLIKLIGAQHNIILVGGGGKTGFIERLESELWRAGHPVLVSLSTRLGREQLGHLGRVEAGNQDEALEAARRTGRGERLILAGPFRPDNISQNKLSGLPLDYFAPLREALGPEPYLLIEADGSAGRPLKCHRPDEPLLPPLPGFVVAVLGLSLLLQPWPEAVHRPEILQSFLKPPPENKPLSPAQTAEYVGRAWRRFQPDLIFLNQSDVLKTEAEIALGRDLAERLRADAWPVAAGSLQEGYLSQL